MTTEKETTIDSPPFYSEKMEKEEQRLNAEADARIAGGQQEMFPPTSKEEIEQDAYVKKAKVKLILTIELEGDKPIALPLLVSEMPSDRVQEMCTLSLGSRRNRRRIEAALDLPEPHDSDIDEVLLESNQTSDEAIIGGIRPISTWGLAHPDPSTFGDPPIEEQKAFVKRARKSSSPMVITHQGEVELIEEDFLNDIQGF